MAPRKITFMNEQRDPILEHFKWKSHRLDPESFPEAALPPELLDYQNYKSSLREKALQALRNPAINRLN